MRRTITSESVMEGHPDKICDQISDGILDAILEQDPYGRVACNVTATRGLIMIFGQITTTASVDIPRTARGILEDIGYTDADFGIDASQCSVLTGIDRQSPDIAAGVNTSLEYRLDALDELDKTGAGDQGLMYGFACDETPELMPMPILLAHTLARKIATLRKEGVLPYLRPDGKTQITIEYQDGRPSRIEAIVIACQHHEAADPERVRKDMIGMVIPSVIPPELLDERTQYFINSTGRFVIGGPAGDSGLTGKKIMVDTYGGCARHGGGSFSGKDPTKVDRSATYMARYIAKNIVAAGLARKCEIQLSYAIGVASPIAIETDCFGTGSVDEELIERLVKETFDLRPEAILKDLRLRRPIYLRTACYGHFGRSDLDLPWERTDKARLLREKAALY